MLAKCYYSSDNFNYIPQRYFIKYIVLIRTFGCTYENRNPTTREALIVLPHKIKAKGICLIIIKKSIKIIKYV